MYMSTNEFNMPTIELPTDDLIIINMAGRGTTVKRYKMPVDVALFWANIGEAMLNWHLKSPMVNVPDELREMADYERYLITEGSLIPCGDDIAGVRLEHGFRVWVGTDDESMDATSFVLDLHASEMTAEPPATVYLHIDDVWLNDIKPSDAELLVQTQMIGQHSFLLKPDSMMDVTKINLEIEHCDGWPIATKLFYDGVELELIETAMLPFGSASTQIVLYGE